MFYLVRPRMVACAAMYHDARERRWAPQPPSIVNLIKAATEARQKWEAHQIALAPLAAIEKPDGALMAIMAGPVACHGRKAEKVCLVCQPQHANGAVARRCSTRQCKYG